MPTAAIVGATLVTSAIASRDNRRAQRSAERGQQESINEERRQFDITQNRLNPFVQAATRGQSFNTRAFNEANNNFTDERNRITNDRSIPFSELNNRLRELGDAPKREDFFTAGALQEFELGLNQAPDAPQIEQFGGQAVAAPELQNFQQSNQLQQFQAGAPELQEFNFDPNEALNNPALQFQREQGERQLDRVTGKNRQLNSGQRLIDAVKFGQGLASQSLGDEFNRQLTNVNQGNQVAQQNFGNLSNINQLQNQITAQNNLIGQGDVSLGNQNLIQQQGLERQNLGDRLNLSNVNQNRLQQQFGLENNQFNQRLDRLSGLINVGSGTGATLGGIGANTAARVGNTLQQQGATAAAGQLGRSNIATNAINQGFQLAGQAGLFNPQPQQVTQFGTIPGSQQTNLLQQQQQGF